MADWDPALYRTFEAERTRPARDLLAQVDIDEPAEAVDLGCGPGNSTELLSLRFPGARFTGIDTSAAMIESARQRLPAARFREADIAAWAPEKAPDLIFANASLQWVPDHATLLPRLVNCLRPGGVLAVQMPDNADEPSHRLMREVAADGPWAERIGRFSTVGARPVLSVQAYYDLLAPLMAATEIWRTTYQHPMPSPDAIVTWLRSTGLRPFLEPLDEAERGHFLDRYRRRIDEAYPRRADGRRLLAFPRLFIVARKPG